MLTLGTITLILSAVVLIGAVLSVDILTAMGAVKEAMEQRAFQARSEARVAFRATRKEETMNITTDQLETIIANAVATALTQQSYAIQNAMATVPNAPWFDGESNPTNATNTVASKPSRPLPADLDATMVTGRPVGMPEPVETPAVQTRNRPAGVMTPTESHGSFVRSVTAHGRTYKVPARLKGKLHDCGGLGNVYTWTGRNGNSVYGVVLGIMAGTKQVQIVKADSLAPISRVVALPTHATLCQGPSTPHEAKPPVETPAEPTPQQTEADSKPLVVFASKRTNLLAKDKHGVVVAVQPDNVSFSAHMIRRGYVPHSVTIEQFASLRNSTHYTPSK